MRMFKRKIKINHANRQYGISPSVLNHLLKEKQITPLYKSDAEIIESNLGFDLSEVAIEKAQDRLHPKKSPFRGLLKETYSLLLVSTKLQVLAGRLAEKYSINQVIVLPHYKEDEWTLIYGWDGVHSKGA